MTYIKTINVNLFNGKFNQTIVFGQNFNILSGVNGTGKTKVLQLLKQGQSVSVEPPELQFGQLKILALSPKRNAEKRAQATLLSIIRNTNLPQKTQELLGKQIRDENYDSYPSFAELLLLKFDRLRSQYFDLQLQQQVLDEFINELNQQVISLTLPGYQIKGSWDKEGQALNIEVFKESISGNVNLEHLSTGEQELLSLVFNIYLMKDDIDIYLIDEPEIHLNWTLERNLFDFLREFSETKQKQVVVTTHSRIIFDPEFQQFVTYFIWDKGEIKAKNNVPQEYKEKIAGESVQLLSVLTPSKKTIFIEDDEHEMTIRSLLKIYQKQEDALEILKLGSSGTVKNLYGSVGFQSQFSNAWFLIDGDNQPVPVEDGRFIKLKKYSIESYYLDFRVLHNLTGETGQSIQSKLINILKNNSRKIAGSTKNSPLFTQAINQLSEIKQEWINAFDCSQIFEDFVKSLEPESRSSDFMDKYLQKAYELGLLETIFDTELISFIKDI